MVTNLITTDKWILTEPLTIADMVDEILLGFAILDPRRKYMFIKWLEAHCGPMQTVASLCEYLRKWLESKQPENVQWEHRLILDEIGWWCELDEQSLTKIMLAELVRSGARCR